MRRRELMIGALAAAGVIVSHEALAATASVTWTVGYTGSDFSTVASSVAGIGTNLTTSSTGQVLQAGSTATVIQLAAGDGAKALIGHPLTIGATTCMITSQTGVAVTVSATSAYPAGTFGSGPAAGTAYSIADVAATISYGLSAANNNLWVSGSGVQVTLSGITTSSTDKLTLASAYPWNPLKPLGVNTAGTTSMPTTIQGTVHYGSFFNVTCDNFFMTGLQVVNTSDGGGGGISGTNCTLNSVLFSDVTGNTALSLGSGGTVIVKNTVFIVKPAGSRTMSSSTASFYGCTFIGGLEATNGGYGVATSTDCAFLGQTGTLQGSPHSVYVTSLTDNANTLPSGLTRIPTTGQVVSLTTGAADARPITGSALLNGCPFNANLTVDVFGSARPGSGTITAGAAQNVFTPPVTQTVTWNVAYNGDFQFSTVVQTFLATYTGSNLTYYSTGSTCPSTAADSTHIVVDPGETTAAIIGHAIQWKSGNICVALSASGSTILVGATQSFGSANFGGTPQAGDAYTVYPLIPDFAIGQSSSGHTKWDLSAINGGGSNVQAIVVNTIGSTTNYVNIRGVGTRVRGRDAPGTMVDGVGVPFIYVNQDHLACWGMHCDHIHMTNLDNWCAGGTGAASGDGIVGTDGIITIFTDFVVTKSVWRGDQFRDGPDHPPLGNINGTQFSACVLIGTSAYCNTIADAGYSATSCTLIDTQNIKATVTATASSGQLTITIDPTSAATINATTPGVGKTPGTSWWAGHANIPNATAVNTISGNVVTLSANLTGTINIGDTILMGGGALLNNPGGGGPTANITLAHCATFGWYMGIVNVDTTTITNCATDWTGGRSGFTVSNLDYASQFVAASGVANSNIDANPKAGNGLGVGSGLTGTDLFGDPFTNSIGAVQFQTSSGATNFFRAAPL